MDEGRVEAAPPRRPAATPPNAGHSLATRASVRRYVESIDPADWLRAYGTVDRAPRRVR